MYMHVNKYMYMCMPYQRSANVHVHALFVAVETSAPLGSELNCHHGYVQHASS